jgi:hypothetical protein
MRDGQRPDEGTRVTLGDLAIEALNGAGGSSEGEASRADLAAIGAALSAICLSHGFKIERLQQ